MEEESLQRYPPKHRRRSYDNQCGGDHSQATLANFVLRQDSGNNNQARATAAVKRGNMSQDQGLRQGATADRQALLMTPINTSGPHTIKNSYHIASLSRGVTIVAGGLPKSARQAPGSSSTLLRQDCNRIPRSRDADVEATVACFKVQSF